MPLNRRLGNSRQGKQHAVDFLFVLFPLATFILISPVLVLQELTRTTMKTQFFYNNVVINNIRQCYLKA